MFVNALLLMGLIRYWTEEMAPSSKTFALIVTLPAATVADLDGELITVLGAALYGVEALLNTHRAELRARFEAVRVTIGPAAVLVLVKSSGSRVSMLTFVHGALSVIVKERGSGT